MEIYKHKDTKELLLLKNRNGSVSTFYLLDYNCNRILETKSNGGVCLNVKGEPVYKVRICLHDNCELLKHKKIEWVI